jgi:hypothetical protein
MQTANTKLTEICILTSQIKRLDRQTDTITRYAFTLSAWRKKKCRREHIRVREGLLVVTSRSSDCRLTKNSTLKYKYKAITLLSGVRQYWAPYRA